MLLWTLGRMFLSESVFLLFFFRVYTQEWNCYVIWSFDFSFLKRPPYRFPQWLHQFIFIPTIHEGSLFSTSSATLVICGLFDDNHSDRYEALISLWFWFTFPWWLVLVIMRWLLYLLALHSFICTFIQESHTNSWSDSLWGTMRNTTGE